MVLKSHQKRKLKAIGHILQPVVNIGREELTKGVVEKVKRELFLHELIKIKAQKTSAMPVKVAAEEIAKLTGCTIVKIIGFTALLYKRNAKKPIINFS
jgi:RNA-binding protein